MKLPSAYDIASTIQKCRDRVPGLRIVVKGDCDGAEWIADHCCNAVLLPAQLPADRLVQAIRDATDAIAADVESSAWPGPDGWAVPPPRGQQRHDLAG